MLFSHGTSHSKLRCPCFSVGKFGFLSNDPASLFIEINHNRDDVFLYSVNDAILLSELSCKKIYNILVSKISISPSAKRKFDATYASTEQALDWKSIYSNAFRCATDTKTREFQYKIINKILPLNDFLFKIGETNSPLRYNNEPNLIHSVSGIYIFRKFSRTSASSATSVSTYKS